MKIQGKAPRILQTQPPRRWKGREGLLPQPGLCGKPPRMQEQNGWKWLLGCSPQTCTPCTGKASCIQSLVQSCHHLPGWVLCKYLQTVEIAFLFCRQLYLVDSTYPREAGNQLFPKDFPWRTPWSCKLGFLRKVVFQGWVSCALLRWCRGSILIHLTRFHWSSKLCLGD